MNDVTNLRPRSHLDDEELRELLGRCQDQMDAVKSIFHILRCYGDEALSGNNRNYEPDTRTLLGLGVAGYQTADKAFELFTELVERYEKLTAKQ